MLGHINEWHKTFVKNHICSKTSYQLTEVNQFREPKSNNPKDSIKTKLQSENICVIVEKGHFIVDPKVSGKSFNLQFNQLILQNYNKNRNIINNLAAMGLSAWDFFSIDRIDLRTTSKSQGYIDRIKLTYYEVENQIHFHIKKIYHNCPTKPDSHLISIPFVPTAKEHNKGEAIRAQLIFEENTIANIDIVVAPIDIYLSDVDLTESLLSFKIISSFLNQEKKEAANILKYNFFERGLFEQIHKDVLLEKQMKLRRSQLVKGQSTSLGPFATDKDALLAILMEKLTITWAKLHTVIFFKKLCIIDYRSSQKWN